MSPRINNDNDLGYVVICVGRIRIYPYSFHFLQIFSSKHSMIRLRWWKPYRAVTHRSSLGGPAHGSSCAQLVIDSHVTGITQYYGTPHGSVLPSTACHCLQTSATVSDRSVTVKAMWRGRRDSSAVAPCGEHVRSNHVQTLRHRVRSPEQRLLRTRGRPAAGADPGAG